MTKILSVCVFLFVAVAVSSPQEEDSTGGNWLLTSCQLAADESHDPHDVYQWFRAGYYAGLVAGVTHASPKACLGEHVTREQQLRVVANL